jgi:hypothetical protein
MTDTAARADVLRDAMHAAVTGDEALIERAYTEDVGRGARPGADRPPPRAAGRGHRRVRGRPHPAVPPVQDEAELIDGLGLLPG